MTEAELLQHIQETVPKPLSLRHYALRIKRRDGTLTPAEHKALIVEINQREIDYAACLMSAIKLADLRGTTLEAQMAALGIPPYILKSADGYRRRTMEEEWEFEEAREAEAEAWLADNNGSIAAKPE